MQIILKDIHSIGEIPLDKPAWIEKKRWNSIQSIKAEADKKRSLASGYLLDVMCRDLNIVGPIYRYTENGKPIIGNIACAFNISHSGNYAVLAYHQKSESIGIDIQKVRTMRDGMANRILHEKEKLLLPEGEEKQLHYLNRLWTVKESFVKMTGEGLSCDFRTIYVDFECGTVRTEDGMNAVFSVWKWKEDYYLAVSTMNKEECEIREI